MEKEILSNYNKVIENWRLKFLEMDQENLIRKFNLEADEDGIYVTYFSQQLRIDRMTGEIRYVGDRKVRAGGDAEIDAAGGKSGSGGCASDAAGESGLSVLAGTNPGFDTSMTIYNMFHYAIEYPMAACRLVPFREVKRVYPFEQAYKNTIIKEFQDTFSGHVQELRTACERLGGKALPQGDAGYELPVFPFLKIAVLFWDKDEEFEAQANMLFDANITDFMHEENVVCVAADAVYYLTLAAGMEAKSIYADR